MTKPVIPGGGGGGGGDGGSKAGTTFVQADSTCFRDVVQRLTSPSGNEAPGPVKSPAPKPTQKLHERRKCNKPKIEIENRAEIQFQPALPKIPTSPPILYTGSPIGGYGAYTWSYPTSPSCVMLLSPPPNSLQASPVSTPVPVRSSNKRASPSAMELLDPVEEEKAIKEKRFYLHPSPRSKPRLAAEPELLTLFPLKSPTTSTATNET